MPSARPAQPVAAAEARAAVTAMKVLRFMDLSLSFPAYGSGISVRPSALVTQCVSPGTSRVKGAVDRKVGVSCHAGKARARRRGGLTQRDAHEIERLGHPFDRRPQPLTHDEALADARIDRLEELVGQHDLAG